MTKNPLNAYWGQRVRAARRERGISLRSLAELTGIHRSQLSKFENGLCGIGDEGRMKIAMALCMRVEELFAYPDAAREAS